MNFVFRFPSFSALKRKKPDNNGGCPNCGADISGGWEFCPQCGAHLHGAEELEEDPLSIFSGFDLFADIDKQLEEMDRAFFGGGRKPIRGEPVKGAPVTGGSFLEIPKTVTMQPRKGIRGGGISIAFSGGTGMRPRVTIHASGDFKPLEPELRKKFGIHARNQINERPEREEAGRAPPEITEEPEAELVKGAGGKISVLKVKLPDVESAKDIKISRLPNSIEIKAYVRNKAYFKLFQVPQTSRVVGTGFKNGVLTINLE